jgi:Ribonuclease G/E
LRRELLISAGPGEWRAALLEDGAPVELYVERGDTRPPGSVHLGRVVRRAPGLDSAFVEIGDPRPGLLPAREAAADGIRLDEGARVLVDVRREAQQDKGARLSTRLRPGGRFDLKELRRLASDADPPTQLYPLAGFSPALALRLSGMPDRVLTDDAAIVPELRKAFPGAEIAAGDEWPIDLDATIDLALAPSLALPGGGTIHIQPTRGATVIDIDTGSPSGRDAEAAALAVNLAAAELIARQLRLRDLGGGIVIDFVGLEGRGARERVKSALAAACRTDPMQPRVLGWSRLGHLELVRPRRGRPLAETLLEADDGETPRRQPLALAHKALRTLQREARARPAANWTLRVSPPIAAALLGAANAALCELETRLGRRIEIVDIAGEPDFDIAPR